MTTVSVIGSAGRSPEELSKLNKDLYHKVWEHLLMKIATVGAQYCLDNKLTCGMTKRKVELPIKLVSGGAPWIDHTAVSMYSLEDVGYLTLHLPCEWDTENRNFNKNKFAGLRLNQLHGWFSEKMDRPIWHSLNTLHDLITSEPPGFSYHVYKGFHARNLEVAKSEIILAYTFHEGDEPKPGSGTRWTWDRATTKYKFHMNLEEL